jgi:hypothetical protein
MSTKVHVLKAGLLRGDETFKKWGLVEGRKVTGGHALELACGIPAHFYLPFASWL